uniref:Fe2OG dioxygenase domain-containing protein n=1 Tax=Coccolithus braarudii TaxID=221442 RepID=A0A7S0LN79_9EUKA|mmetsp:Transcript_49682/g.106149  ORF Transcript_49682/g.106149 Transcript_49682/m.106149 type:complete len:277 (+) Transcript_49682:922-1752(+)
MRRAAGEAGLPLPCWRGTVYDERPAATCENVRSTLLLRWRKHAEARCAALEGTMPRAGSRRRLPISQQVASSLPSGHEIHVRPVLLHPKVRLVEDFVTAEEAAHIIKIGVPRMHRSLAGGRQESIRTSTTAMLPASDSIVRAVTERASYLSGYPVENIEPLQLVKYVPGQKYEPHFDYGAACDYEENLNNGHRHVTLLVYLSSLPDEYLAHTHFPKLSVKVTPTAHDAVVFNDCLSNGQEDPRTLHGGAPPTNGTKIAINIWIRAKPFGSKMWWNF